MEIQGVTLLFTLASLMVTFAGLSALFFVLRQAAGGKLSVLDRYLAKTVLTYTFILIAAALLPALLALYSIGEEWLWRISSVLFGVPMLCLQVSYPHRRRAVVGTGPPPSIRGVLVVLGSVATLSMLCYTPFQRRFGAAVYVTTLTVDFFTVVFGFLNALDIIMQQPMEESTDVKLRKSSTLSKVKR